MGQNNGTQVKISREKKTNRHSAEYRHRNKAKLQTMKTSSLVAEAVWSEIESTRSGSDFHS